MGYSGDEFLKIREMKSYRFDYYEPIVCDMHYWFDVEANSREEAEKKAKELIERGYVEDAENQVEEGYGHEREGILYFGSEVVENYKI